MDRETRLQFWKKIGEVNPDVIAPLINTAFNSNLPKWPSLEQSFITLKKNNGNTIIATDGLSNHFDPTLGNNNPNINGFEVEIYVETNEEIADVTASYQFDLVYQMSLQVAGGMKLKEMLDKYGILTSELYDIRVPAEFQNSEGRAGVILGLPSSDVQDSLQLSSSSIKIVNIKLLTLDELKYATENGASGRENLKNLFAENSKTVSSLTRKSVVS